MAGELQYGMITNLLQRWSDWTGDRHLEQAIRAELRRMELPAHAAKIRRVRLVAIQRPGWVQVRRFQVETLDADKNPYQLIGLARDDGRQSRIKVLLTRDVDVLKRQLDEWSEGLIRRG
ncbi:MAG: hypothetical protein AAGF31_09215 [Planctomycetota bacterium]